MAGAGFFINAWRPGMMLMSSIARRTNFPRFRCFSKNFFDGLSIPASSALRPKVNAQDSDVRLRSEKRGRLFSMFGVTTSDDYRPVAWMGRVPLDVTTILVGIHVALAIVACLLVAAGGVGLLDLMMFDSARVLGSGQVWRLATYAFIHSPMQLLWFAIRSEERRVGKYCGWWSWRG